MNDRIKLAELIGWKRCREDVYPNMWDAPDSMRTGGGGTFLSLNCLPDPENNANDCEALITHLNELGHKILVEWFPRNVPAVQIKFTLADKGGSQYWHGDDWKEALCKLALKVLEQDD